VYATHIAADDRGLRRHPALASLVGETVGDEERAAYLAKV
jgi:ATP-dependent DNA helicase RecG